MSISSKKIKILVTDDHKVLRHGLINVLECVDNFEIVGEASNGVEALAFLEEYFIDVVLLDVDMPIMNGNETLINIRQKYPQTKVIMFTMHHTLGYENYFLKSGAVAYLDKNSDFEIIRETILKVSKQQYPTQITGTIDSKISDKHLQLSLTDIEHKVLIMILQNKTGSEILKTLDLKEGTLKYYRKSIYKKTYTSSIAELTIYAVNQGLISGFN